MDLQQLTSAFLAIVGAASLFGGYRLFATHAHGSAAPAAFFAGFGAVLIVLVVVLTLGPWRERPVGVFPIRILDLNIPPAAIDRPTSSAPPPPAYSPASR